MPERPILFLIDGNNQMYRAYHAIRGLTGPDGRSTNAIYGFITMLRKLITDHEPAYIATAFDLAGPTFRSAMQADYKATRTPMPADLAEQVPFVHEACEALGVRILTHTGFEADDVIATLATRAVAAGFDAAIVTGDKDFFQMVDGHVRVYNPRDEGAWFDAGAVKEKFGVRPDQVVDVLALMGDAIDNVKGVPGIGEKGARDLIAQHETLDRLLEAASSITQKRYREALTAHADDARLSRDMVRLHCDVPVEVELETLRYSGPDQRHCYELFSRLGFKSLVTAYAPTAVDVEQTFTTCGDVEELQALAAHVREVGHCAVHIVTDEQPAMQASLVGLAIGTGGGQATYVPLAHTSLDASPNLSPQALRDVIGPLLADPSVAKSTHDVKALTLVLERHGLTIDGVHDDVMLASYVHDAATANHALEPLALERLGYKAMESEVMRGKGVKALPVSKVAVEMMTTWACERADITAQLATDLRTTLRDENLTGVYEDFELALVPALVAIERAGIKVDTPMLGSLATRMDGELEARASRIYEMAGMTFNINSPKQLGEVLFEKMQLPVLKRTGAQRTASTAAEVLEELALTHDIAREILDWRAMQKLKGTYVDALPLLVNPKTGRVHTTFNQAVAATGRLSSSDPNLQNIPIRTELGREIRGAFIAEPGHVLISADYSQIELRVLAHVAQEQSLIDAFRRGDDIHDQTSAKVFGTDSGLSEHELRRRAKIINYALLYGKTAFTLAKDIGVTQQAAQEFIDAYFAGYPSVRRFIDETIAQARDSGVVSTLYGRRRRVPELTSRNRQISSAAERVTVNLPIQGTAADILKRAMIDLHAAQPQVPGLRMILTVHDELVFEASEGVADEAAALVKHHMESAVTLDVPLDVDVGIGRTWNEAKA
ncbi:MAG TPA: DNA polymerase I [Luteitalea sp.]|nr:DNA polymerase I [Luteitalea sp.]